MRIVTVKGYADVNNHLFSKHFVITHSEVLLIDWSIAACVYVHQTGVFKVLLIDWSIAACVYVHQTGVFSLQLVFVLCKVWFS
jgi:hypothetical protein